MAARDYGQYDGVSTALELVGERWALLIVRDLLVGPRRYTDLKAGLPRVPTNILSTRLRELQDAGIIRRAPLAHRGVVYELTAHGLRLESAVLALARFGAASLGEPSVDDIVTGDSLTIALRAAYRPDAATGLPSTTWVVRLPSVALGVGVFAGELVIAPLPGSSATPAIGGIDPTASGVGLDFSTDHRIHDLMADRLSPHDALASGAVTVLEGDPALLERFARVFCV